jgi:cytoskeleton protein RodZ
MNTIITTDEGVNTNTDPENPGITLSQFRQQKGYSIEYVASKLHLRVNVIELIEQGNFSPLPQAVFIKGYLRAYAKLLGLAPEPFLATYNEHYDHEKTPDRVALLWQTRKESNRAARFIRWITLVFALGVLAVVGIWWQKNGDNQPISESESMKDLSFNPSSSKEIKLTDISKMHALIQPQTEISPMENHSG